MTLSFTCWNMLPSKRTEQTWYPSSLRADMERSQAIYWVREREKNKQTSFTRTYVIWPRCYFLKKHIYICLCLRRLQKDGFHTVGRGCLWEVRLRLSMFESPAIRSLCVHRGNSRSDLCSPQEACSPGMPKVCSAESASPRAGRGPTQVSGNGKLLLYSTDSKTRLFFFFFFSFPFSSSEMFHYHWCVTI